MLTGMGCLIIYRRLRHTVWCGLPLALGACTVPPSLPEPRLSGSEAATPVPVAWAHAPAGAVVSAPLLADWWRQFDDPLLLQWVQRALVSHVSVRQAQAALRQSRAQAGVVAAGDAVSLSASGTPQRVRTGESDPSSSLRFGLDAVWEADVFGARQQARAASLADVRAAEANVGQARVSLVAEVALLTLELQGLAVRQQLAQDSLARQEESVQLTAWRVQAGLASSVDLEQARTSLAQTRATLPGLVSAIGQALGAVAVLTAQDLPTVRQQWEQARPAGFSTLPEQLALGFPAEVMRQRPDVRLAEERVYAAWARVRQSQAERYPNLTLSGSLGLAAPRLGDLFNLPNLSRNVLASLSASLFDGGAQRARQTAQQAVLDQALVAHESAVRTALQEVENALLSMQANRQRLVALDEAVQAASQAEALSRQRYASGLIDYRILLDTERTLLAVQSDQAVTRASYSADFVRLYKALGGGWQPELTPFPPPASPSSAATVPTATQAILP